MKTPEEKGTRQVFLSVIIPCFNEEESLHGLIHALTPLLENETKGSWELIFVDDGSTDRTPEIILEAHDREKRICGVILSRNFGHQAALFAGLAYASGSYIGIMDADMQDPPEVLMECLRTAQRNALDVVYGTRKNRKVGWFLRICYFIFYRLIHLLAEDPWPLDAGDFSIFNRKTARLLMQFQERLRVLRGLRSWIGLKQGSVAYDRPARSHGHSKYSFFKLFNLAISGIVNFSNFPLRLASLLGFGMSILTLLVGALLLINRLVPRFTLFHYWIGARTGTATIVLLLLGIGSLLFLCMGILGEYLALVVKEIKRRPVAIVQEHVGVMNQHISSDLILESTNADA